MRKSLLSSFILFCTFCLSAQTPCINGTAGQYPCNQMTLQSFLSPEELLGEGLNDIWGWTDPVSGKEYALVGLTDGVTFVDITDPINPIVIGKLVETHLQSGRVLHGESAWRDIKVYKDHAYVVSDGNNDHGMQIFDLTRLRDYNGSSISFDEDGYYDGVGSSHNIVINEETGYAYIVGARNVPTCGNGGLHILNLENPKTPVYEACFDNDGYTHDAQCVIYTGPDTEYQGKEICFNSNENTFTIIDVDDKSSMSIISRTGYDNVEYTHQGWLTEDQQYFLMNDELDELEFDHNPRTLIWDVRNLDEPVLIGSFYNEAKSIDHNLYTKDGLVYESNYSSGLRVLSSEKISDGVLREVAFFDTNPARDIIQFEGAWSSYPYFESGNIIVSDMYNGFYVLQLNQTPFINKHPEDIASVEGDVVELSVETVTTASEYTWQVYNGNTKKFENIEDGDVYSGTASATLGITLSQSVDEKLYRCMMQSADLNLYYSFPAMVDVSGVEPLNTTHLLKNLSIYPNPTTAIIHIDTNSGGSSFKIIDVAGQIMKTGTLTSGTNPINVYNLESGHYILLTKDENGITRVNRFLKN